MLVLCPTPIGNLSDVTPRQISALREADIIACEDSRTTGKLLELLGIARVDGKPRFVSYHDHNATERASDLVQRMLSGEHVVLVTDAGTPAISDPGYRLVAAAREAGLNVSVLPGAVAGVLAVAGSGLPTDRWAFEGFLPAKGAARVERLEALRSMAVTGVLYESPHRIETLIGEVARVYGEDHPVCVARELTKLHEEWLAGSAGDIAAELERRERQRGEFCVVVGPGPSQDEVESSDVDPWIAEMITAGVKPAVIKRVVSNVSGLSKSEVFDRMERIKSR